MDGTTKASMQSSSCTPWSSTVFRAFFTDTRSVEAAHAVNMILQYVYSKAKNTKEK